MKIFLLLLAQSAELDALAAVPPGDAAAYVAAREKVLALGSAALREPGAADRWTAEGWVRAMAAEACRLRLENPDLAKAVDRPAGLDPSVYSQFRRPEPMCLAELARLGSAAVPLLLERWRWTFSQGATTDAERGALRLAILSVPGRLGDPRARPFLLSVLEDPGARDADRQAAAVSLAQCAGVGALAPLTRLLDGAAPAPVREACARALGRIPDVSALEAIHTRLKSEEDAQVRGSFVAGLGLLGSAWAWDSRGVPGDAIRKGCAEALVEELRRSPKDGDSIARSLSMTAWPESEKALETLGTDAARAALPVLRRALARRAR